MSGLRILTAPLRVLAAPLLALTLLGSAHGADLKLPRDGWVSWQVASVPDALNWCCYGSQRDSQRMSCKLDGNVDRYGSRDDDPSTDAVKLYVRLSAGKVEKLRTLSASCPAAADTPIQDLGIVDENDSARWVLAQIRVASGESETRNRQLENGLTALAMHRGDIAQNELASLARTSPRFETRKKAIFWLGRVRGDAGADIVSPLMFADPDAEVRKQAAFALSQSKSARVAPDLIRLGDTDAVGDVRAEAWFWLAHTGDVHAEQPIGAAMRKDPDERVREKAVFALSQLPDERATKALISAAEDRTLSREQRKRAVFWLSQSESDSAQAYLEKVLAVSAR
jgi:hypothetical protein